MWMTAGAWAAAVIRYVVTHAALSPHILLCNPSSKKTLELQTRQTKEYSHNTSEKLKSVKHSFTRGFERPLSSLYLTVKVNN